MPADLPWGGYTVRFVLHVRKFFCRISTCAQRIFTERLPGVVEPLARKTVRLHDLLQLIAFAVGGEAGARLSERLGMATSPATLIRMMRHSSPPAHPTPRVLGVDDWAKRRGASYGTILVDLEAHRVIDLLPDRKAETFQAWLEARPGIEIISRDRGERYATGGKAGAPDALHIADRWHLIRNWAEVVERVMRRHQTLLRQVKRVKPLPSGATVATLLPPKSVNRRRHYADARREQVQRERFELWTTIRERHAKGASLKDIERALRLNYKTVRKYAHAAECPQMQTYPPQPRLLTPYEPYLRARWAEGCRNGKQLFREIQTHGYRGSRVLVSMFVAQLRRDEGLSLPWLPNLAKQEPVTPRDAVNLFLVRASERTAEDVTTLNEVRSLHAEFEHVFHLNERFTRMVRDQLAAAYDVWMTDAHASSVREVRQFARNLQNDEAAIRAALHYPWSQGQVEGQVHRLKLVKRSMYGRANFDLLRLRVMHAA
jgi:transposase